MPLSDDDARALFRAFDSDRSGAIDVAHFVRDYTDGLGETARRAALRRVGGDKVGSALHFDEDTGTSSSSSRRRAGSRASRT